MLDSLLNEDERFWNLLDWPLSQDERLWNLLDWPLSPVRLPLGWPGSLLGQDELPKNPVELPQNLIELPLSQLQLHQPPPLTFAL